MSHKTKQEKKRDHAIAGPVQPESVLYRLLQMVAREVARSLTSPSPVAPERFRSHHGPSGPHSFTVSMAAMELSCIAYHHSSTYG
jgi:hypothetical protein